MNQSPVTVPPTSPLDTCDKAAFDQGRWDTWVTKCRLADAAFTKTVRTLAILGVAVAVGVGAVWIILG